MRELLEVTVTCRGCAGRVPVHLDTDGAARLVGRCETCGEDASCELHPDPRPLATASGTSR